MSLVTRTSFPSNLFGALVAAVTHAHTLEGLTRPLLELLQRVTGLESTYLTRLDAAEGTLCVLYARNTDRLSIPEGLSTPWEATLCKRALDEARFYTDDVGGHWGDCEVARALGVVTYLSAPVRGKGGELFGTLCAASDERKPLPDAATHVLGLFAYLISQQVDRERLLAALHQANQSLASTALTDAITQLPNRRALLDDMQQRLASLPEDQALIVAFIDLDEFKPINDRFGHEAGDQFLQTVAKRLRRMLRDGDVAARMGGDEFVVLAVEQRAKADEAAAALSRRLESATRGRFKLDAALVDYEGASVGVVVAEPGCSNAQALLNRADAAMEAIKQTRKHTSALPTVPAVRTIITRYEWPVID
ncbi:GGDEF domain-containing protein [Dyella mobilis]|uniref:Sensor domain-containing diguanylate cyclase n=1 Tax=Dyella mobilis TaxID=1849582 RepID=A0ABS2KCF8_9GAMM|nr:sensor domain-containing diguanylate cyclase [Dyella mobilis]MBM7128856.1 sensor domain-containing diguanylate cyclase [Dyella mobilis]GLQ99187.1 GGDEF domain-containing protein [Dyella mobilis]